MTPHFTLAELTRTNTGLNNTPPEADVNRLKQLALNMEHVRSIIKRPVIVTSAYRSEEVNKAAGGKSTSHHRLGYAADFKCAGLTPWELVDILQTSWLLFDQLINEQEKGIVHISFAPRFRREVLTQKGKRFLPGNLKG